MREIYYKGGIHLSKDLKDLVDEYAKWDKLQKEAKNEVDNIKAELQKKAVELLKDSKLKQIEFWGTGTNKAVITQADTVKILLPTVMKMVLGSIYGDLVKEKPVTYEPTEPFKRILAAICQGSFTEITVDEVIRQIGADEKTAATLKKKLKGNWDKDVAILKSMAKLESDKAEHFAYFIKEAIDFEKTVTIMEAAGHKYTTDDFRQSIEKLKQASGVEESLKIGIEYEVDESGAA